MREGGRSGPSRCGAAWPVPVPVLREAAPSRASRRPHAAHAPGRTAHQSAPGRRGGCRERAATVAGKPGGLQLPTCPARGPSWELQLPACPARGPRRRRRHRRARPGRPRSPRDTGALPGESGSPRASRLHPGGEAGPAAPVHPAPRDSGSCTMRFIRFTRFVKPEPGLGLHPPRLPPHPRSGFVLVRSLFVE